MKNQYVGDIGDYTKLGILRSIIHNTDCSIGVNWYLTPDDEIIKDGRHTKYLDNACDTGDNDLFSELFSILKGDVNNNKNVELLQKTTILPNTLFFSTELSFKHVDNIIKRLEIRDRWHNLALTHLSNRDIVFLDPDNGLSFTNVYNKDGNKCASYEEVCDYYRNGSSVIIYNHRDRSPLEEYIYKLRRFSLLEATNNAFLICLTAPRYTQRDYLFIIQPEQKAIISQIITELLCSDWSRNGYLYKRDLLTGRLI